MAGRSWRYVDHTCAPNAERQGANTIWSGCEVRLVTATGDTARVSLFGSIIEREGHFKLLAFR